MIVNFLKRFFILGGFYLAGIFIVVISTIITRFCEYCPNFILYNINILYLKSTLLQTLFSFQSSSSADDLTNNAEHLAFINEMKIVEHEILTEDGYLISLQQLLPLKQNQQTRGTPILLLHGLMQCSESFLCNGSSSLAVYLANSGFNVFIGNNRGSKYSRKHSNYSSRDNYKYWDFSLDEMARFDFPAFVTAVLSFTGFGDLSIIGFSQGAAQVAVGLSMYQPLCNRIKVFIALSPALKPPAPGLCPPILWALSGANQTVLFTLFGRGALLESTEIYQRYLPVVFHINMILFVIIL